MLLFKKPFHEGLASGAITLTFRRWKKPHVRVGGRYRCHPIGVLEVDDVRLVNVKSISGDDAKKAGFPSRGSLVAYLAELGELDEKSEVWRVSLRHGGDGDRVELALEDDLSDDDVAAIRAKLARMDAKKPWTAETLAIIEERPRIAASRLAESLGRETLPFKVDVRRLKKLGLTQSFEVGYELAPRGKAYLARVRATGGDRPVRGSKTARGKAVEPRSSGGTSPGRARGISKKSR